MLNQSWTWTGIGLGSNVARVLDVVNDLPRLNRFCQRLRQLADTSRDGVGSWLFSRMKRDAVPGMSINGRQASV